MAAAHRPARLRGRTGAQAAVMLAATLATVATLAVAPGDQALAGRDAPDDHQHHDGDHHLDVAEESTDGDGHDGHDHRDPNTADAHTTDGHGHTDDDGHGHTDELPPLDGTTAATLERFLAIDPEVLRGAHDHGPADDQGDH